MRTDGSRFCILIHVLLAVILCSPRAGSGQVSTAEYKLVFEATWSAETHPDGFPEFPHFSAMIGGIHNSSVTFWSEGVLASPGMESVAETGSRALLREEVNAAILGGTAEAVFEGGHIPVSPGSRMAFFSISSDYPLITIVSMLAPSPDWFVGVSGQNLLVGDEWVDSLVVPLPVFDAGTDGGVDYTSPNEDTDPAQPVSEKTDGPFALNNIVGSFTFTRQDTTFSGCDNPSQQLDLPAAQCEALVALHDATGGSNWTRSTDWRLSNRPCSWFGVTCSTGNVVGLSLPENNLAGRLPPELGSLSFVDSLRLENNALFGAVPLPAAAVASNAAECSLTNNSPGLCLPDIADYQSLGPLCGLGFDPACTPVVHIDLRLFLQGRYDSDGMSVAPAFREQLPSAQPYASPLFDGTIIEHDGTESVFTWPTDAIDWVSLHLRTGVGSSSTVPGSQRAGLLLSDGSVVDTNGTTLLLEGVSPGSFYVVAGHRNHTAVMSSAAVDFSDGYGNWDFSIGLPQAYSSGRDPMRVTDAGATAFWGGNANADFSVQSLDINTYLSAAVAGPTMYDAADFNLDGVVDATDLDLLIENASMGASSQVP